MEHVGKSDVELGPLAGDLALIHAQANRLRGAMPEQTLAAISRDLHTIAPLINPAHWDRGRGRKTTTEIMRDGAWGCSAHAQVACHLARACDVPAIVVKTLRLSWLATGDRSEGRGEGHVYVEAIGNSGRPLLWDPQGRGMWPDYALDAKVTPDGEERLIYEKGDPGQVVLSHHGVVWEAETKRLFPATTPQRRSPRT